MKITINKQILLNALQLIVSISPKATSENIINNVLIETDQNQVWIKATNFEVTFSGSFPAVVEEEGKICIQTTKLFNLVRNFSQEMIEFQSTPQNWVYLHAGSSKIKLPGMEPDAFPQIQFQELEQSFQIPSEVFKKAIDRTFFSIGENESRKNLMGLNLQVKGENQIRWMGADAFRISHEISKLESAVPASGNIIIPKKSLLEIKKILDFIKKDILVSYNDNIFQLEAEQIQFKTRLIEADYPNLDSIVDHQGPIEVKIPKQELIRSTRILNTLTDDDPNSVLKLTFAQDQLVIESQKLENGEGNDLIPCTYKADEVSIGLNIQFFLECLQVFEPSPDPEITFSIVGPVNPFMIQSESWEDFKTILMPVKIKW